MVETIDTPSQSIINDANATATVTDARGRKITLKKTGPLDRMRLFEVIGGENVKNEAYFGYAMLACHVTSIDGDPVYPSNKIALEGIVQDLGDDGFNAVAEGVTKFFSPKSRTEDEAKEELKN